MRALFPAWGEVQHGRLALTQHVWRSVFFCLHILPGPSGYMISWGDDYDEQSSFRAKSLQMLGAKLEFLMVGRGD